MVGQAEHPALISLRKILLRELGGKRTAQLLTKLAIKLAENGPHTDVVSQAWSYAWFALAEAKPECFSQRTVRQSSPSLALLYALQNEPDRVALFTLSRAESLALREGRRLLGTWTGLRGFRRPCANYLIQRSSQALGFMNELPICGGFYAVTLNSSPHFRHANLFWDEEIERRRREDPSGRFMAALVLHEEIHQSLRGDERVRKSGHRLVGAIEEAATSLSEVVIELTLFHGEQPSRSEIVTRAEELGLPCVAPFLRLWPDTDQTAALFVRSAIQLSIAASESGSDAEAGILLNDMRGRNLSPSRWVSTFVLRDLPMFA